MLGLKLRRKTLLKLLTAITIKSTFSLRRTSMMMETGVQENDGMPLFSEGTCDFFVSDQEEGSVYFYSRIVGTTFCGKLLLPADVESVIA